MVEYKVKVKQQKSGASTIFIYSSEADARKKLDECREWNRNNPNDKALAYMSVDNVVIRVVK